jgi:predicted GH43/DUF377 family glycosyl hydrolase
LVTDRTGTRLLQRYFAFQVGCGSGTGTCSVKPAVSLAAGPARWWVLSRNALGLGTWSKAGNFTLLPTVALTVPDALATESPLGTGSFRVTRTGPTTGPLTVSFTRTGTATAGGDYVNFPLSLTIPAGASSADLLLTPVNDSLSEGPETVVLSLAANTAYKVGTPSTATLTITSEDLPAPTLVAPTGLIGTATPTYTWQAVASATEYSLWVEDTTGIRLQQWYPAAQAGCASTGLCQLTPDLPLVMGDAKWWVRARNAGGEGPQSAQVEFAVAPLFSPVLLAPVGVISTATPTYTWQAVPTATEYSLWVEDTTGIRLQQWYPAAQTGCASTGLCQLTPDLPLAAGAVRWWVRARHTGGEGPVSSQGDFTVDPLLASRRWSTWSKWAQPVFTGVQGAADPSIVRDGALYRMAYTCSDPDSPRTVLCMVESQDGFTWQNIPVEGPIDGLILRGAAGDWDENLETSHLSNQGGEYRLLYSGYRDQGTPMTGFPGFLGLAQSADGRSFSRASPAPMLQPTPGWHDNDAIFSPTVLSTNGTLVMIYTGHCYTNCTGEPGVRLLAATSTDGITWTKAAEPVLSRSTEIEWMRDGVAESDLIQGPDGMYYLFFTGLRDDQRVIGVARGAGPFGPWEINPDPIVRPTPGSFDEAGALAPEVIIEQGKARMWYLGFAVGEFPFIGYAESVWPVFVPAP